MNHEELKKVLKYQSQIFYYLNKWLNEGLKKNKKCEFCDSIETIKYPAEGWGDVWLCDDCKSIGSGESSDL